MKLGNTEVKTKRADYQEFQSLEEVGSSHQN